jgi:hypothetical protein
LKKLKLDLPSDPAIPLLGTYLSECKRDICTPMFTATLFLVAELRSPSRCPSVYERIKKMCYIYTMEYYSAMKKNEIMSFCRKKGRIW